mmetsp:Transcript_3976/g.11830  ORF Transcript_3976/g.11830 Transcript_3976/m.11830 type:complete len:80 (+) Transcript_3976:407-646(+)
MSMSCPCLVPQVQYMHDQGVIHRDLKLENVLLNHADDCKVCDFGLAHLFRRERGKIVRRSTRAAQRRTSPKLSREPQII